MYDNDNVQVDVIKNINYDIKKSILVLHSNINNIEKFIKGINSNVEIIKYNEECYEYLLSLTDIEYLGFVWDNHNNPSFPFFIDNSQFHIFSNKSIELLKSLGEKNKYTLDLISCNLYKFNYKSYENVFNADIRYSTKILGNKNWILNDNIDLKNIYFNNEIDNWNYKLSVGDLSTFIKGGYMDGLKFHTDTNTYKLHKDIEWIGGADLDNYIVLQSGEVFDGDGHIIDYGKYKNNANTTDGRVQSLGLFDIGENITINPIIKDLTVLSNISGTGGHTGFGIYGGGIIRDNNANFIVKDCKHIGDLVNTNCGGIVGAFCFNFEIHNCKSKGNISGPQIGGIVGGYCGYNLNSSSTQLVKDCKYKGDMLLFGEFGGNDSNGSGGICGGFLCGGNVGSTMGETFSFNETINIINCKVKSNIYSDNSGGIVGSKSNYINNMGSTGTGLSVSGSNTINIFDCKFKGKITGLYSGGIVGSMSSSSINIDIFTSTNTLTISECVVESDLFNNNQGGILGDQIGQMYNSVNVYVFTNIIIDKCIYFGSIAGIDCGGIIAPNVYNSIITNCYTTGTIGDTCGGIAGPITNTIVSPSPIPTYCAISYCYAYGMIIAGSTGIDASGLATVLYCYARNLNNLNVILSSLGLLQPTSWERVKHSYPILKLNHRYWKDYHKFDEIPKLI